MAVGLPATIADGLVDRLNELRGRHVDRRGIELEQIKFSVQALKRADQTAYLSVKSMIAALEGNSDEILASANQMRAMPASLTDRLNLLLSLSIAGMRAETVEFASELMGEIQDVDTAMSITDGVISAGGLDSVEAIAQKFAEPRGLDPALFEDVRIVRDLRSVDVSEEQFNTFAQSAREVLTQLGWPTASMMLTERRNALFEGCGVFTSFLLRCDADEAQEIEEKFMDSLIEQEEPLFTSGKVACAIQVFSTADV